MKYFLPITLVFLCYHAVIGSDETVSDDTQEDNQLSRVRRGGLSMLRLGRGLQMLRLGKRGIPMLRLGRSVGNEMSPEEFRFALEEILRSNRQVPLPRYGKDLDMQYLLEYLIESGRMNDLLKGGNSGYGYYDLDTSAARQIRPAPRPGMRYKRSIPEVEMEKERTLPYPRLGRESDEELDDVAEKSVPLPRIGKETDDELAKRAMRMLRLGRGMRMLRLGKRPFSMLRLGRSGPEVDEPQYDPDLTEADKRALRLLRLGKRPFSMLRLGRSDYENEYENDDEKRALRLLRLGKRDSDDETQAE